MYVGIFCTQKHEHMSSPTCPHCASMQTKLKLLLENYEEIPHVHTVLNELKQTHPSTDNDSIEETEETEKEDWSKALFSILPYTLW